MPLRLALSSLVLLFSLVACQGSPPADTTPTPGPGPALEVGPLWTGTARLAKAASYTVRRKSA